MQSSQNTDNDSALLHQLQDGNVEAFNILYEKYWQQVYSAAYRRTRNTEHAKDITQNIFTHLWLKRKGTEIKNVGAYLNVAVRNQVLKLIEKNKQQQQFFEPLLQDAMFPYSGADNTVLWKEFVQAYEALIDNMPPKRQEIFRLHIHEEMPTDEIAGRLNISRKTVQNQLGKAIHSLRASLSQLTVLMIIWDVLKNK
jgi:RNA polymerase sigma-70 factor (ECF subfamily)